MRIFTEEQILFRDAYRKFLNSEIAPHMEHWRKECSRHANMIGCEILFEIATRINAGATYASVLLAKPASVLLVCKMTSVLKAKPTRILHPLFVNFARRKIHAADATQARILQVK